MTETCAAPVERFDALAEIAGLRHGFLGRVPGVDVRAERATALARLDGCHQQAIGGLGLDGQPFVTAEQVHGRAVAVLRMGEALPDGPITGADGLVTDRTDVCLGIYAADCAAVFLIDPRRRVIGLAHSGRKGTELGIVPAAIAAMRDGFGCDPADMVAQISPCIRPPWYEVDFAAEIAGQCRALGVGRVSDAGVCTAADPERYYSYRREKGQTGRMLAVVGMTNKK